MKIKTIQRNGLLFSFINEEEFEEVYKDVFIIKEYDFKTTNKSPLILDCGSHIGVSILYFKKLYPEAKIIGFEANPNNFKLLEFNIQKNNLKDMRFINVALSNKEGEIDFYVSRDTKTPWTWGDAGVINKWYDEKTSKIIKVPSMKLSSYINKSIDLIKLDIEGMEEVVLNEIEHKLKFVKEIFMEFHGSSTNKLNDSKRILNLLKRNKFDYSITQEAKKINENEIKKTDPYWLIIHASKKF